MSVSGHINPLPSAMKIKKGEGGHIKRLENLFQNAKFYQDIICYDNSFITDVIGSKKVNALLNTTPHIEHRKSYHEKLGMFTQRRLGIILKIRSKLTPKQGRATKVCKLILF